MKLKKLLPYFIAVGVFILASVIYFYPVLKGEQIKQSDITQFIGMSKEIKDFRVDKNDEPYWTGTAFSGMPAYQISAYYPNDFVRYIDKTIRFLPRPADYLFLYFISFFLLLTALKVDWRLAILGALSFGFSTYLIIIFGAGHNAKAHAIAYIPAVLAGVLWVFQKRYLLGFIVTTLAMALEVNSNHIQMTYYFGFMLLIFLIIQFIDAIKTKQIALFVKHFSIICVGLFLGITTNATRLLATKEYASFSTRGKSELTINPDGTPKEQKTGLSKDYITEYSYGVTETFNLLIPRFMGGGTVESLDESYNFYQFFQEKVGKQQADVYTQQVLTYWGKQPIVEAPAYIGAILFFLFFVGIFLVDGKVKQWLVAATIFSIVLSWGKNFSLVTDFFINYVPLYNKFRAVSSIQIIAEICIPILAFLGLKEVFSKQKTIEEKKVAIKKSFYIIGGVTLFFTLFGSSLFAFEGLRDAQYSDIPQLLDALIADRKKLLFTDSLRSFALVFLAATLLWFFVNQKMKQSLVLFGLAGLILFDLISIDKRYVNKEDFTLPKNVEKPFTPSLADKQIMQDKSHYRVANFTVNPMNDGSTSYFHHSIGGYHAAKMMRYQELFEYQIAKNNMEVLNMLNTKYLILPDDNQQTQVQQNTDANGNAWFVEQIKWVDSADKEMQTLDTLNTKSTAVIDSSKFTEKIDFTFAKDSTATISLQKYAVNKLVYQSKSASAQFAVFSEIYYPKGWNAYIDGKLTPHYRVNYVLRGMQIPAGTHQIEFKFEPTVIKKGKIIGLVSYALLLIIPVGWFLYDKKRSKNV